MISVTMVQHLVKAGWTSDRHGHLKITTSTGKVYRAKMQKLVCRLERQVTYGPTEYSGVTKDWVRVESDFYKNINVDSNGDIYVGRVNLTKISSR